jgi:hypothetical protein
MTEATDVRERLREQWQQLETRLRVLEDSRTPDLIVRRGTSALMLAVKRIDNLLVQVQTHLWPEPTTPEPSMEVLEAWLWDGVCEATDG